MHEHQRILGTLSLACLLLATGACQKKDFYQPGSATDTATLVFTSRGLSAQPMLCVPERGFLPARGKLSGDRKSRLAVTLDAGIEQVVGIRYDAREGNSTCRVAARFTPETGARYRARFLRPGGQCALAVLDAHNRAVASGSPDQWLCP